MDMKDALLAMNYAAGQVVDGFVAGINEAAKIYTGEAIMKNITIKIDGKEIEAQVSEEDIKKLTQEPEWPQVGDEYWFLSAIGSRRSLNWSNDYFDNDLMSVGNVYRTKEEAEAALRAQKLIAAVAKRRKELNGDWKVNWKAYEDKHFIRHNGDELEVKCRVLIHSRDMVGVYKNADAANTIIVEFHDELTWYFTEYLPSIN